MDLADCRRAALDWLLGKAQQLLTLSLGTSQGQFGVEVVQAMETASGSSIPYMITERRPGVAAMSVTVPTMRFRTRSWRACRIEPGNSTVAENKVAPSDYA